MNKAEKYTQRMLDEITGSTFSGNSFRIKRGRREEVVDEDDAIAHWLIQPKGNDSPHDLTIIHDHNQKVLNALRSKGLEVPDRPDLTG